MTFRGDSTQKKYFSRLQVFKRVDIIWQVYERVGKSVTFSFKRSFNWYIWNKHTFTPYDAKICFFGDLFIIWAGDESKVCERHTFFQLNVYERGSSSVKMVYKRLRGGTSVSSHLQWNFVEYLHLTPPHPHPTSPGVPACRMPYLLSVSFLFVGFKNKTGPS